MAIAAFAVSAPVASAAPPACTSDPGHQPPRDINTYLLFSFSDFYVKGGHTYPTRGVFTGGNIGVNGPHTGLDPNIAFATNMHGFVSDGYAIVGDRVAIGPGGAQAGMETSTWDLYTNQIDNNSFDPLSVRNSGPWCYTLPVIDPGAPSHVAFTHSTGPYNPTMPSFPSHAVLDTKPDLTVSQGNTANIAPGDYGTVDVRDNATLNFSDGIYNIDKLDAGRNATFNTQRHTEIRIATDFLSNDNLRVQGSNYARFYIRADTHNINIIDNALALARNNYAPSPDGCNPANGVHGQFYVLGSANLGDCVNVYGRIYTNITRNDQGLNVTYAAPGGVTGTKYLDVDSDGNIDPGEPGLAGWTFFVDYNDDGNLDPGEPSDVTDANGDYEIQDVDPGTWNVREVSQAGWTCSAPHTPDVPEDCVHPIDLGEGEVASGQDFANYQQASVSGTKWEDVDGSHTRDPGDDGLAGWTFYVDYSDDGNLDPGEPSDVSDSNGDYNIIGVNPGGPYKVREVSQALWSCTSPDPNCYWDETFSSGSALSDRDFGNTPDASASTASGTKWQDNNGNGNRDPGDDGLAGWTFYVDYDDSGTLDPGEPSAVSDSNGDFTISGIAVGDYTIREASQAGWSCTSPTPNCLYTVNFTSGSNSTGNDFGNVEEGSVSGTKWLDVNGNGNRDPGDDGLAGWTFYVDYNDDGFPAIGEPFDTSDSNGDYNIVGVKPGNWKVREATQAGWSCTSPTPNCLYTVNFTSGSNSTGNDFGNHPDETAASARGTKWQDVNGDGIRDPGDDGLAGWTFYVDYNHNGSLDPGEPSAVSDSNGDFDIVGVSLGDYEVREVGQTDWNCTSPAPCYYSRTFSSGNTVFNNDFGNHNTPPPPPSPPPTPPTTPPSDGGGKKGGTGSGKTSAKISGKTGCATFSLLRVRGQGIKTVVFRVDGKVVSRHKAAPYGIRIGRNYPVGAHKVRVTVTFDTGATKTASSTFHHCATRVKTRLTG